MNFEILRVLRNILLRCFAIGFVITLVLGMTMMIGWMTWMDMAGRLFHTDPATLTPVVLKFFTEIRFFLIFIVLTPALALHWTIKRDEKK
ncbi:MAG TPA: hypothetical protein VEF34_06975 [Syntrophobacteraceae bacterium]|nr:hypothetical protein [Syntrophobacteraceae bacterium]